MHSECFFQPLCRSARREQHIWLFWRLRRAPQSRFIPVDGFYTSSTFSLLSRRLRTCVGSGGPSTDERKSRHWCSVPVYYWTVCDARALQRTLAFIGLLVLLQVPLDDCRLYRRVREVRCNNSLAHAYSGQVGGSRVQP